MTCASPSPRSIISSDRPNMAFFSSAKRAFSSPLESPPGSSSGVKRSVDKMALCSVLSASSPCTTIFVLPKISSLLTLEPGVVVDVGVEGVFADVVVGVEGLLFILEEEEEEAEVAAVVEALILLLTLSKALSSESEASRGRG